MRSFIVLLLLPGCAAGSLSTPPAAGTVRQRLATPARLFAGPAAAAGSITAGHKASDGWDIGSADLALDAADLTGAVDDSGALELTEASIALAPIELPESVFGEPAELRDVRLTLAAPVTAALSWSDDDDATGDVTLSFDVDWSIFIHGTALTLGTQHLAPLPASLTLGGAGDQVEAHLAVDGSGQLWSWADLVEVTALQLAISPGTTE